VLDARCTWQLAHDKELLLVLPEPAAAPRTTALLLRHCSAHCVHPSLASLFAPLLDSGLAGLESARSRARRCFKSTTAMAFIT
jgi:hypothetical protein